jgi:hypothetical protein
METVLRSMKSWNRALNDVTRLCIAATTGCFLVGGAFLVADFLVPVGSRGIALLAVGCFFLVHGLYELARHRLSSENIHAPSTQHP